MAAPARPYFTRSPGQVRLASRTCRPLPVRGPAGDLNAAVLIASGLRPIIGDAEGKGLSVVQQAFT
jgi:hypothetical protein